MKLSDKLRRLIGERDQAAIAAEAGISAAAFSSYVNDHAKPGADAAVRLAKVLKCDLNWVLDDDKDWNEKDIPSSLDHVPGAALIMEVRRRYVKAAIQFRETIREAATFDWEKAARALAPPAVGPLGPIEARAFELHMALIKDGGTWGSLAEILSFQPWALNKEIPEGIQPDELRPETIRALDNSLSEIHPWFKAFVEVAGWRVMVGSGRFDAEEVHRQRRRANEIFEKIEAHQSQRSRLRRKP